MSAGRAKDPWGKKLRDRRVEEDQFAQALEEGELTRIRSVPPANLIRKPIKLPPMERVQE